MSDPLFAPLPALSGLSYEGEGVLVEEVSDTALVSIAVPHGGAERLRERFAEAFGLEAPAIGASACAKNMSMRILALQPGQYLAFWLHATPNAFGVVSDSLGDAGYYTDQSDGWASLRLTGANANRALERICMLDLASESLKVGAVVRTLMEHISVILLRESEDEYILFAPRSFSRSFLQTLQRTIADIDDVSSEFKRH